MTACSNHPGTPSGLALAELLGEVESLVGALRDAEERWCEANGISRSHWLELKAIKDRQGPELVAGASPVLISKELVEACPGGYRLSNAGRDLLWALDRLRFDWVDEKGAECAARELRQQASVLRRLAGKLST